MAADIVRMEAFAHAISFTVVRSCNLRPSRCQQTTFSVSIVKDLQMCLARVGARTLTRCSFKQSLYSFVSAGCKREVLNVAVNVCNWADEIARVWSLRK